MQLLVIRHGIAEPGAAGQPDATRELTRGGEKKLKRAVRGMRALGLEVERVLTSPWSRARATAELLGPLGGASPVATDLLCQAPRAELLAMIAETGEDTAVVGHEPWLGELVAWLAFGDMRPGDALALKKGGLVALEGSAIPGGMMVRSILPPRVLRELSRR